MGKMNGENAASRMNIGNSSLLFPKISVANSLSRQAQQIGCFASVLSVMFKVSYCCCCQCRGGVHGVTYTHVAVIGTVHTVLLTSDGNAVAYGKNEWGECSIPNEYDLDFTWLLPSQSKT